MLRLLRSSVRKAAKKGTSCTFFSFEYFCLRKKLAGFLKRASCPPLSIPYTDAGKNCTSLYNSCPPKAFSLVPTWKSVKLYVIEFGEDKLVLKTEHEVPFSNGHGCGQELYILVQFLLRVLFTQNPRT